MTSCRSLSSRLWTLDNLSKDLFFESAYINILWLSIWIRIFQKRIMNQNWIQEHLSVIKEHKEPRGTIYIPFFMTILYFYTRMRIRIRSDPLIFGPPDLDPDPVLFSSDPDPTCNNGFMKLFSF